jgi:hypothetical protein
MALIFTPQYEFVLSKLPSIPSKQSLKTYDTCITSEEIIKMLPQKWGLRITPTKIENKIVLKFYYL